MPIGHLVSSSDYRVAYRQRARRQRRHYGRGPLFEPSHIRALSAGRAASGARRRRDTSYVFVDSSRDRIVSWRIQDEGSLVKLVWQYQSLASAFWCR